jgi:hypothetical protein
MTDIADTISEGMREALNHAPPERTAVGRITQLATAASPRFRENADSGRATPRDTTAPDADAAPEAPRSLSQQREFLATLVGEAEATAERLERAVAETVGSTLPKIAGRSGLRPAREGESFAEQNGLLLQRLLLAQGRMRVATEQLEALR